MARRQNLRSQLLRDGRDVGKLDGPQRTTTPNGKPVVRGRVLRVRNGVVQRALRKVRLLS